MLQFMWLVNIHDLIEEFFIIPIVKSRSEVHTTSGEKKTADL